MYPMQPFHSLKKIILIKCLTIPQPLLQILKTIYYEVYFLKGEVLLKLVRLRYKE